MPKMFKKLFFRQIDNKRFNSDTNIIQTNEVNDHTTVQIGVTKVPQRKGQIRD